MKENPKGIFIHIQPNDLVVENSYNQINYRYSTSVYVLCKNSFVDCPNFDINNLINDDYELTQAQKANLQKSEIKLNYTFDEIMELKNNNIDFYLVSPSKIKKILLKIDIEVTNLFISDVFLLEENERKYIYFSKETKFISIKFQESYTQKMINQIFVNNQINTSKTNFMEIPHLFRQNNNNNYNNYDSLNEQKKSKIIQSLILIYVNEKEIKRLYTEGTYDLKNYYLINKSWIDKFKEIFNYNEICNIPDIKSINNINECLQKIQNLESLNEIKNISNKIYLDNISLINVNLSPIYKSTGEYNEYYYPSKFIIINKFLFDLIKQFTNESINSEYEINFGKSSLYIRLKNQDKIIYIYNYKNNLFNLLGIISLIENYWKKYIYDPYLSKYTFNSYLVNNNIMLNAIKQKQNLYTKNNDFLGYIYLICSWDENTERQGRFDRGQINYRKKADPRSAVPKEVNNIKTDLVYDFINVNNLKTIKYNNPQNQFNICNNNNSNNYDSLNEQKKSKIIQSLILIYANEKEIKRLYAEGTYDLKNYYLINKSWIDKFKEIFNYNEICNIPEINQINSINDCINNLNYFESLIEIQNLKNKINTNNISILSQYDLIIETKINEVYNEYNFPINFTIIQKSLLNKLESFRNNIYNAEYEISFGKSCLCIRWIYDPLKIYFYNYDDNSNSFNLLGIFELFLDFWRDIYNRHFTKKSFVQYLTEKVINFGLINQKQNYISSKNEHIGFICITSKLVQCNENFYYNYDINNFNNINSINNINDNNIIINNIIDNNDDFNFIYENHLNSLNSLNSNNLDLQNIEIIKNSFDSNSLFNLPIYIIETEKLEYCLNLIKQYKDIFLDFSFYISETDILSCDNISESINYSFINEEIVNYFKIQNKNNLSKGFYFRGVDSNFVFYPIQNCLLKVLNYEDNKFNLQLVKPQPQISISASQNKKVHTLGLCNIGSQSYINATLQCLFHIASLKDYFLNDKHYPVIMNKNAPLSNIFGNIIKIMWTSTNEDYFFLNEFINTISRMNNPYNLSNNDSKDLINFLLQALDNELHVHYPSNEINLNNDNIPCELYEFRKKYDYRKYSIISQTFFSEHYTFKHCQLCGFKNYVYCAKCIILFTLEKIRLYKQNINQKKFNSLSLNDCFDYTEQPQILNTQNKIYCQNCLSTTGILKYNKIYSCPEILTIIIERGNNSDIHFSFPMYISLEKYVADKTYNPYYDLISVLAYQITDMTYNHFVAYCRSPVNGEWFYYDDTIINICEKNFENKIEINAIPYILFYQRRKNKCINFIYEGKKGFYDYNDDNKYLSQAYNEFRNLNLWAPKNAKLFLNDEKKQLDVYKTIIFNGINDGDNIVIKI